MGFLRTLLWILLGYYLLKLIGRLMRPWIRKFVQKKASEYYQKASSAPWEQDNSQGRVGEVTIDRKPPARKHSSRKVGEYIEYEEIE